MYHNCLTMQETTATVHMNNFAYDRQTKSYNQEKPLTVLHVKEVAFPIVTGSVLDQVKELSAVTFIPVWNLTHLIRITVVYTSSLTTQRCEIN